jgi:N utilization substance protein A
LVGQRGVRVSVVTSELGGEKIDIIEWSEVPREFIEDALSPAKVLNVEIDEEERRTRVEVSEDQQSLAIGKGGQNVRLAAKLTGWKIDIRSAGGENLATADEGGVASQTQVPTETEEMAVPESATDSDTKETTAPKEERGAEKSEEKQA